MEISNVQPIMHEVEERSEEDAQASRSSCACRNMFDVSVLRRMRR
ncbi:MAG: hypothetical protein ACTSU5_09110 [Promethearchaeota archaeon]